MISPDQVTKLIEIDEQLCTGCRKCVDACHEGAIQLIGGKAKLVKAEHCDGLGACIGECPAGALKLVERPKGLAFTLPPEMMMAAPAAHPPADAHPATTTPAPAPAPAPITPPRGGCPGKMAMQFQPRAIVDVSSSQGDIPSQLGNWPLQLHLVNPAAPCFNAQCHLLLAAHCSAFALGGFHGRFLAGKTLVICCPKLLQPQERMALTQKLAMILAQRPASLTIVRMQVPCCGGLVQMAQDALAMAQSPLTPHIAVVGIQGDVLTEDGPAPEAPAGVCPCQSQADPTAPLGCCGCGGAAAPARQQAGGCGCGGAAPAGGCGCGPRQQAGGCGCGPRQQAGGCGCGAAAPAGGCGCGPRQQAGGCGCGGAAPAGGCGCGGAASAGGCGCGPRQQAGGCGCGGAAPAGGCGGCAGAPAGGCGCEGGCAAKRDGQPCSGACGAKQCGGEGCACAGKRAQQSQSQPQGLPMMRVSQGGRVVLEM
eukprot:GAFH01001370.1.p1 GENE.GAFH01001370.1~~GAFH01001370.1.p1  ORF type:complete len:498 (-),score=112.82 GAFH01001370.1:189-1628(-)